MINLSLEIAEVEAILKHVGNAAYAEVAPLIAKIHGQATAQVVKIQQASVVEKQQSDDAQPVA
jgi:hypothetical protein